MTPAQAHRLAAAYAGFRWAGDQVSTVMLMEQLDSDELTEVMAALACIATSSLARLIGPEHVADMLADSIAAFAAEEAATPGQSA